MDKSGRCRINRSVNLQPSVVSERMVLRPILAKDVPVVQRLARSRKVAYLTHWLFLPYSEQKAQKRVRAEIGTGPVRVVGDLGKS
jgi:hypothetical protein